MQILYLYFTIFCFIFFSPVVSLYNKKFEYTLNFLQSISLIIIVSLFFGMRDTDIGLDSKNYLKMFHDGFFSDREKGEPLFNLLIKVLHVILYSDKSFLFIMSFIIAVLDLLFYKSIDKNNSCRFFWISICFYYFYQFHLNLYRNAIAIGIVNLAYLFWIRNKKNIYFFLGIIASLIHYSALIFLLFPIIDFVTKSIKKRTQHFLLLSLLLLFFKTTIVEELVLQIPSFCQPVVVFKEYLLNAPKYIGFQFHFTHSHFVSILIILLFNLKFNVLKKSPYFRFYLFHTGYLVFISFFKNSVALFDRLYFYIQLFEPVLIYGFSEIFKEKKYGRILIYGLCILYSIFTIFIWGPRNFIKPYYI